MAGFRKNQVNRSLNPLTRVSGNLAGSGSTHVPCGLRPSPRVSLCSWGLARVCVGPLLLQGCVCNPGHGAEYGGDLLSASQVVECAVYGFLGSLAISGAVSQDVGQCDLCSCHQNCGKVTIPHFNVLVMGEGEGERSDHGGVFFWQIQQLHTGRLFLWLSTQLAFGITHSF